ncbi:hypothetical protein FOL46_001284, partial [Perkinsus olseni]
DAGGVLSSLSDAEFWYDVYVNSVTSINTAQGRDNTTTTTTSSLRNNNLLECIINRGYVPTPSSFPLRLLQCHVMESAMQCGRYGTEEIEEKYQELLEFATTTTTTSINTVPGVMNNQPSAASGAQSISNNNGGPLALLQYLQFVTRTRGVKSAIEIFTDLYESESELLTSEVYIAVAYSIAWYGASSQPQGVDHHHLSIDDRRTMAISILRKGIKRLREGLQVPNTRSLYATTTSTSSSITTTAAAAASSYPSTTTQQLKSSQYNNANTSSLLQQQHEQHQYYLLGRVAQIEVSLVDFQAYCNNDKDSAFITLSKLIVDIEHFYLWACINNAPSLELNRIRKTAWMKWEDIINKDFDCDAQTIKGMQFLHREYLRHSGSVDRGRPSTVASLLSQIHHTQQQHEGTKATNNTMTTVLAGGNTTTAGGNSSNDMIYHLTAEEEEEINLSKAVSWFEQQPSINEALRHLKVGKILLPDTALLEHFNDKNYSPSHHQQEHGDVTQRHEGDDDDDDDDELKALQLGDLAATLLDTSDMGGDKEIELHHVNRPDVTKMLPYNPQEDQVLSGGVGLVSSSSSSSTTAYGRQAADDHHHHHHRNPKNGKNGSVDEDDMMMMIPMIIQTVLQVLPKRDLMTSNYQSVAEECAKTMKAIPILRKVDDDILIDIDRTTRQNAEYRLAKKDQPDAVKGKSSSAAEQQGSAAAAAMTAAAVTAASQALGEATAAVAGGADHRHPSVVVKKEEP